MENLPFETNDDDFNYETSPIIDEMIDFIDDIDYYLSYAAAIASLPLLPESAKQSIERTIFDAMSISQAYKYSLGENVEDLEDRADALCHEMESFDEMMQKNENALDRCLIHIAAEPKITLQFGINVLLISECALC
jgi:hypothetical protein